MRRGDKKIRRKVAFIEEARPKMGNETFSTGGRKGDGDRSQHSSWSSGEKMRPAGGIQSRKERFEAHSGQCPGFPETIPWKVKHREGGAEMDLHHSSNGREWHREWKDEIKISMEVIPDKLSVGWNVWWAKYSYFKYLRDNNKCIVNNRASYTVMANKARTNVDAGW